MAAPLAGATLGPLGPALAEPPALDAALFGPVGAVAVLALVAPLGLWAATLLPLGGGPGAPTPAAAPAHVLALLVGGSSDASRALAAPAWGGAGAVGLGGLWSRRLGPHREAWSWDVVEVAALDLFMAEPSGDHLWGRGSCPRGAAWGGAAVRLFRVGLSASHHHLAAAGSCATAPAWALGGPAPAPALGALALACVRPLPPCPPLRAAPAPATRVQGPEAPSEAALAAWALAVVGPTGGGLAAWGLWAAPLYVWAALGALGAAVGIPLLGTGGGRPAHSPLAPLAHAFGAGLPWGPAVPGPRWVEMPNQIVCFRT